MKVFITGGSGFVGQELIRQLLKAGHQVKALVRNLNSLSQPDIETVIGDATQPHTLKDCLTGSDAVIHLVGIIKESPTKGITFRRLHHEATTSMVNAAQEQGVQRYLQMSANGTRENAQTAYHQTKWSAEQVVSSSSLDWTIFRPSLIYGPNDEFINMLAKLIKLLPVVPVFGDGQYSLQPVHVSDVASSFVSALSQPETIGQTYCCCGPQVYTFDQLLDNIARALGQVSGVRKFHQPLFLMEPFVSVMQNLPFFPITSDQLKMLTEGNICSDSRWQNTFDLDLHDLDSEIRTYLR